MSVTINFVRILKAKTIKQYKNDRRVLLYAVLAMVVVIIAATTICAINLYLANQISTVNKEQTRLTSQWESFKTEELSYVKYISKIKILSDLFQSRLQKQAALKKFRSFFGEGATVVGLKYSAQTEEIVFQIRSDSVFVLDQVLNKLGSADLKQDFGTISKDRLSRDDQGQYVLAVRVSLKTNK